MKTRKQFLADPGKVEMVKKITHATTDTEAINRALDIVIATCYDSAAKISQLRKKSAEKLKSHRVLRKAVKAADKPLSEIVRESRDEERF